MLEFYGNYQFREQHSLYFLCIITCAVISRKRSKSTSPKA